MRHLKNKVVTTPSTDSDISSLSPGLSYVKIKGGSVQGTLLKRYAVKITDAIKETITGRVHDDPIAKQYIPQNQELKILPEERIDPIGDDAHSPVKGLVHRHTDRVLLKLANVCAVYCRYCFRREMIGPGAGVMNDQELEDALSYIRGNPQIWEVILTGGDPLVVSPRKLSVVLDALEAIPHVQIIRIHTRVPIAAPDKITQEMGQALKRTKPVYVALHVNHANELTEDVRAALDILLEANCTLLSQSVFLKGVNDNADTLEDLYRTLITLRVKPYYLHHPDLAPGTSHFRLDIAEGQAIMQQLQARLSGICLPTYMLDIPGGYGKIPLTPCMIEQTDQNTYIIQDSKEQKHVYPPKGNTNE